MRLFGLNKIKGLFNRGFYESQINFGYQEVGSKSASYVDCSNLAQIYHENALLKLVINKKAQMMSNMSYYVADMDGEEIEDNELLGLLNKPNPIQSGKDLIKFISIHKDVYGQCFLFKLRAMRELPSVLWGLPSGGMKIKETGKFYRQSSIEDIIEYYELEQDGIKDTFKVNEIIYIRNQDIRVLKPASDVESLRPQISNVKASYEARNGTMNDRGALGILKVSSDDKGVLMNPKYKEEIESKLARNYGIKAHQKKTIVTSVNADYTSMTFPVKDLMLHEEEEGGFIKICDMFGLNANIFSSIKGSTFNNVKESIKQAYQDTIIPEGEYICEKLTEGLGLEGKQIKCRFDVPVLKEDEQKKENTLAVKQERIIEQLDRGLITEDEARQKLGI